MDFWTVVWPFAIAVLAIVAGYIILDEPNIVTPYLDGWKEEHKGIGTFENEEYSTSSSTYVHRTQKTWDYFTVYGITIRNEKWFIGRPEAKITSATIKIWNSQFKSVTERYRIRLWENHKQSTMYPLFPGLDISAGEGKTIGAGDELDLVIAYHQENEPIYYRFTIESHRQKTFPIYADRFKDPMPNYGIIQIHGHRINKDIYIKIESESKENRLKLRIVSKKEFPPEIT
jgi:hypothetical protein